MPGPTNAWPKRSKPKRPIEDAAALAELAHHWVAATRPADLDKALGYVRRAGDAARDALAPDDAIRWYQQALDLLDRQIPPDQHSRAQLLVALGTQQSRAGQPEYRDTLTRAASLAEELGDTDTFVQAALGFSAFVGGVVGVDAAKRVLRAALDAIGADESATRARLLAAYSEAHDAGLEWRERRDLALESVDVARLAGDDTAFVEVCANAFLSLATPEYRDQTIADVERAVAIADRLGDPFLRCTIRFPLLWARYQRADLAAARTAIDDMATLADQLRLPHELWMVAIARAGGLLLAGHADDAEQANQHALELGIERGKTRSPSILRGHPVPHPTASRPGRRNGRPLHRRRPRQPIPRRTAGERRAPAVRGRPYRRSGRTARR